MITQKRCVYCYVEDICVIMCIQPKAIKTVSKHSSVRGELSEDSVSSILELTAIDSMIFVKSVGVR